MILLHSQEKTAIGILILVTIICGAGTFMLDGIGKDKLSKEYHAGLADGTLVNWEGVVSSVYHATGGSVIMNVSGVSIFIPASAPDIPYIPAGTPIRITGTVQHWKGKEEIVVEDGKDISLL
ncbi:MAG TPA: hypothetical protein PK024_02395 [Methanospirillum sp.]|uniref:hypothetical protein n=1 Tax=Methanospirillum sp. TaxID=45200 RepID=UPI002BBB412A|nr:hypothetical protein [Methanospirillum sp.]HOJ95677.1 hypothetical protein [Methanospirillum sp.]HOL40292.1 hypothetical protein [Methanospirillum sp.]HPP77715.1 hypothetical protein [Methanospirillum sp.]